MDSVEPAANSQAAAEADPRDAANSGTSADLLNAMRRVFDADFYRAQKPELDADEAELIAHFVAQGWREGLDPGLYAPYISSIEEIIRHRGAEFDVFYITRYQVAEPYIDAIRNAAPRAKIVFCNADLHFLREMRSALLGQNFQALDAALGTRDAELALMRRVDVTLTYSDTEAAVILSHNFGSGKIARCPWVVDVPQEAPAFAERSGIAFLGSFQHPPNEEAIRFFIDAIMPKLRQVFPGLKFHIYGAHLPEKLGKRAADDVIVEGYAETVESVYDRHRLFVAPLLSGAGLKGKVVGALAAGIPIVMTALAAEGVGLRTAAKVTESVWASGIPVFIAGRYAFGHDGHARDSSPLERRWLEAR